MGTFQLLNVVLFALVTETMMNHLQYKMTSSESESDTLTSFKDITKVCAWCKEYSKLKNGKPYCQECASKMYKECSRCHLPYPEMKHFVRDPNRCNACQLKLEKERAKRNKNKQMSAKTSTHPTETNDAKRNIFEQEVETPSKRFKLHIILSEQ